MFWFKKKKYIVSETTQYKNLERMRSDKGIPELYNKRENCCGCSACYSICPRHAITMEPDIEGFLYPVVDAEKCVACNACIRVCSFKEEQKKKGYI